MQNSNIIKTDPVSEHLNLLAASPKYAKNTPSQIVLRSYLNSPCLEVGNYQEYALSQSIDKLGATTSKLVENFNQQFKRITSFQSMSLTNIDAICRQNNTTNTTIKEAEADKLKDQVLQHNNLVSETVIHQLQHIHKKSPIHFNSQSIHSKEQIIEVPNMKTPAFHLGQHSQVLNQVNYSPLSRRFDLDFESLTHDDGNTMATDVSIPYDKQLDSVIKTPEKPERTDLICTTGTDHSKSEDVNIRGTPDSFQTLSSRQSKRTNITGKISRQMSFRSKLSKRTKNTSTSPRYNLSSNSFLDKITKYTFDASVDDSAEPLSADGKSNLTTKYTTSTIGQIYRRLKRRSTRRNGKSNKLEFHENRGHPMPKQFRHSFHHHYNPVLTRKKSISLESILTHSLPQNLKSIPKKVSKSSSNIDENYPEVSFSDDNQIVNPSTEIGSSKLTNSNQKPHKKLGVAPPHTNDNCSVSAVKSSESNTTNFKYRVMNANRERLLSRESLQKVYSYDLESGSHVPEDKPIFTPQTTDIDSCDEVFRGSVIRDLNTTAPELPVVTIDRKIGSVTRRQSLSNSLMEKIGNSARRHSSMKSFLSNYSKVVQKYPMVRLTGQKPKITSCMKPQKPKPNIVASPSVEISRKFQNTISLRPTSSSPIANTATLQLHLDLPEPKIVPNMLKIAESVQQKSAKSSSDSESSKLLNTQNICVGGTPQVSHSKKSGLAEFYSHSDNTHKQHNLNMDDYHVVESFIIDQRPSTPDQDLATDSGSLDMQKDADIPYHFSSIQHNEFFKKNKLRVSQSLKSLVPHTHHTISIASRINHLQEVSITQISQPLEMTHTTDESPESIHFNVEANHSSPKGMDLTQSKTRLINTTMWTGSSPPKDSNDKVPEIVESNSNLRLDSSSVSLASLDQEFLSISPAPSQQLSQPIHK